MVDSDMEKVTALLESTKVGIWAPGAAWARLERPCAHAGGAQAGRGGRSASALHRAPATLGRATSSSAAAVALRRWWTSASRTKRWCCSVSVQRHRGAKSSSPGSAGRAACCLRSVPFWRCNR